MKASRPTFRTTRRPSPSVSTWVPAINISGVRIALYKTSDLDVSNIWVKFGLGIAMGSARTQRFVAQYLRDNNNPAVRAPRLYLAFTWVPLGYIVSEYIDGQVCDDSDTALAAAAVQALITIPSPSLTPGPIGGGLIEHPFFVDRRSSVWYESVEELQDHVNGVLSATERTGRVNFSDEPANGGLLLCVSDLVPVNFMKDRDGEMVAVDFGGYAFLPSSLFPFALRHGGCSNFALRIATMLEYPPPPPAHVAALMNASYALVPYSSNDIGVPKGLRSRLGKRLCI